ncbi:MAG TPA: radical SAM protein [Vicinamibacterales bacterium]|nr:radical SAM protein [Vicinamibacterales bacterium]
MREGGAGALVDADHRADDATYQEVECRSALNRVQGMPFSWTLNPYRGCTHGCHYCFARRYHAQFEMNSSDEFASVILVKTNVAQVLKREIDRPTWKRDRVAFGTATDPYQPIEGHYKLTRRCLEVLTGGRTPVGLITKGPMIVRDKDVLRDLSKAAGCTIYVSVPSVDEDAWRALEPGVASPLQRLRALRELVDAGIHAGVLMAPIVPGFTSSRRKVEDTIKAIADHGACFIGCAVMRLQDGTRDHFMKFIAERFPSMLPGMARLYGRAEAPAAYRREVQSMIGVLQERYGLRSREEAPAVALAHEQNRVPEQVAFAF